MKIVTDLRITSEQVTRAGRNGDDVSLSASSMLRTSLFALLACFHSAFVFSQEALSERLISAEARTRAAITFFAAEGEPPLSLDQGFPELSGAPLTDTAFLNARRQQLREREDARARERLAAGAAELELLRAVWDAEDTADALEARLLAALSAGLSLAPGFREQVFEGALALLRRGRAGLRGIEEGSPQWAEAAREALAAAESEQRLVLYRGAALRRMVLPGDRSLEHLVEGELLETTGSPANRDRLQRSLPLLGPELARRARLALGGAIPVAEAPIPDANPEPDAPEDSNLGRLRTDIAVLQGAERKRQETERAALETLRSERKEVEGSLAKARALSFLDSSRSAEIRRSLQEIQRLTRRLRAAAEERNETRQLLATERATMLGTLRAEAPAEASAEWEDAFTDLSIVLGQRDDHVVDEIDALMSELKATLHVRRQLGSIADFVTQAQAFEELRAELAEAPLWLQQEWRKEIRVVRSLPERIFDLDTLVELASVSFDLLVLVVLWVYLRRAAPRWIRRGLVAVRRRDVGLRRWQRGGRAIADRQIEPIARYGVDAAGAFVLHTLLLPRSEFLALGALLWIAWALTKSVPPAIRLLLAVPGHALDPLSGDRTPPEVEVIGVSAANWFLGWWILSELLLFVAVPLLQADRLESLIAIVSWAVFTAIVIATLWRLSHWVRQFLANLVDQTPVSEWLAQPTRSIFKRIFLTAFGIVSIAIRLVFWLLVGRGWLSSSGTSLIVSQFKLVDAGTELLPKEDRDRIRGASFSGTERSGDIEKLLAAFVKWQQARRGGTVGIIGDRGVGKTVFLEQARTRFESRTDLPVTVISVPHRRRTKSYREQLQWLLDPLGIAINKGSSRATIQKRIIDRLETLPPQIFLIDDVHFLLRRTVGGFDLLKSVLDIIQVCSDDHFWALTLHRPAWTYVKNISTSIRLALREKIELSGLGADVLEESLVRRTRAAGYDPRFEKLLQGRLRESDHSESRARVMYWRIVSEASRGNPEVALEYWLSSLGPPVQNGDLAEVPVYLHAGHAEADVEKLSDEYLFLLTALVIHDGLPIEDLAEVLNVVLGRVRMTCQHLESLRILERNGRVFQITPGWQPAVLRVLDQKQFAH